MRSNNWIQGSYILLIVFVFLGGASSWAQEEKGKSDLDKAFEAKLEAKSTKDLDGVVKLCESAIEKGLNKDDMIAAKQLASATLMEHANQLGRRVFVTQNRDRRWRIYRSQALSRLRKAIEFDPELADAYLLIAKLNGQPGGDEDEALEALDKAIELAGDDNNQLSDALFLRANLTDDADTKISDLNQAIKINPDNLEAVRRRASYYLMRREPKLALPDLKTWIDSDAQNVETHLQVVRSLMGMGAKFDEELQGEALDIVDAAIELEPDRAMSHTFRAQLNMIGDNGDEAISDASRAIKLDRRSIGALMIRASVYSDKGGDENLKSALEDVEEVLDLMPNNLEGVQLRGIIFSQQRNFKYAIKDFKNLAEKDPTSAYYKNQLAILYNANDEPTRAVQIYRKLLADYSLDDIEERSPGQQIMLLRRRFSALRGVGDARLSIGEHVKAIANYEEALEIEKQINEIEEAEEIENSTPADDGVLNNLAWVLATSKIDKVRDGKRAIELATKAAEITEYKEAHILSTLASGYAEIGEFDKAIEWVEKAIEVNQENGKNGTVGKERTKEQRASLQKELDSYKKDEPWRELQDVEAEKEAAAKKAKKEKAKSEKGDDEDKDNDKDNDKDEDNDEEKDEDKDEEDGDKKEGENNES